MATTAAADLQAGVDALGYTTILQQVGRIFLAIDLPHQ